MMQQTGILNRINNDVVNWQYVESIDCNDDKNKLTINYASGKSKEITSIVKISKILDLMSIFPNILDDDIREKLKQATMQGGININPQEAAINAGMPPQEQNYMSPPQTQEQRGFVSPHHNSPVSYDLPPEGMNYGSKAGVKLKPINPRVDIPEKGNI